MSTDLEAIELRYNAWYDEDESHAAWPERDSGETMEHYIVRCDVPDLIAAIRATQTEEPDVD